MGKQGILAILVILQLSFVIKLSTSEMHGSQNCNNCTESTMPIDPSQCMSNETENSTHYCTVPQIQYILKYIKQYQLNKQLKDLYPCTTGVTWSCTATPHPPTCLTKCVHYILDCKTNQKPPLRKCHKIKVLQLYW